MSPGYGFITFLAKKSAEEAIKRKHVMFKFIVLYDGELNWWSGVILCHWPSPLTEAMIILLLCVQKDVPVEQGVLCYVYTRERC